MYAKLVFFVKGKHLRKSIIIVMQFCSRDVNHFVRVPVFLGLADWDVQAAVAWDVCQHVQQCAVAAAPGAAALSKVWSAHNKPGGGKWPWMWMWSTMPPCHHSPCHHAKLDTADSAPKCRQRFRGLKEVRSAPPKETGVQWARHHCAAC